MRYCVLNVSTCLHARTSVSLDTINNWKSGPEEPVGFVCGLDSAGSASPEIRSSTVEPWKQSRALIRSASPLSGTSALPSSASLPAPSSPCWSPPSLLASITTLSPAALAPPSVTLGVTESGRSGLVLPTATSGISQKSVCLQPPRPCRATPT